MIKLTDTKKWLAKKYNKEVCELDYVDVFIAQVANEYANTMIEKLNTNQSEKDKMVQNKTQIHTSRKT